MITMLNMARNQNLSISSNRICRRIKIMSNEIISTTFIISRDKRCATLQISEKKQINIIIKLMISSKIMKRRIIVGTISITLDIDNRALYQSIRPCKFHQTDMEISEIIRISRIFRPTEDLKKKYLCVPGARKKQ